MFESLIPVEEGSVTHCALWLGAYILSSHELLQIGSSVAMSDNVDVMSEADWVFEHSSR